MKSRTSISISVFLAALIAALPSIAQARGTAGHMGLHPLGSAIRHHHADSSATAQPANASVQTAPRP